MHCPQELTLTENLNSRIQAAVRALGPRRESVSLPLWLSHSPRWTGDGMMGAVRQRQGKSEHNSSLNKLYIFHFLLPLKYKDHSRGIGVNLRAPQSVVLLQRSCSPCQFFLAIYWGEDALERTTKIFGYWLDIRAYQLENEIVMTADRCGEFRN